MISLLRQWVVLSLDPQRGRFIHPVSSLECATSACLLVELAFAGKITLDEKCRVVLLDVDPIGDPLLDKGLKWLARSKKAQPLLKWIFDLTMQQSRVIESFCLDQMVLDGILERVTRPVLGIFKTSRFFPRDPSLRPGLISTLSKAIQPLKNSSLQTSFLLGLVFRTILPSHLFTHEEISLFHKNSSAIFAPLAAQREKDPLVEFCLSTLDAVVLSQLPAGSAVNDALDKLIPTP